MRRALARCVLVGAWVVVGALAGVVLARIVAFDDNRYFLALNSLTLWLFLPAYVVLAVAIALRRYVLVAAATLLVVVHVLWLQPVLGSAEEIPDDAFRAPRLRIFSANLTFDNGSPEGIIGEIRRSDADVLVLQELSPHWERALRRSGISDSYPHQVLAGHGVNGAGILSRQPLVRPGVTHLPGTPLLHATIDLGRRSVRIFDVHPSPPVYHFDRYQRQTREITRVLDDARLPVIAAGDFNTSPFNEWMLELDDRGLRDAHQLVGRGLATTWPNGYLRSLPVRLDHVLVSRGVVPLQIREGEGDGSDHKPLIADLAVLR